MAEELRIIVSSTPTSPILLIPSLAGDSPEETLRDRHRHTKIANKLRLQYRVE